jgi:hypothetical protein
MNGQVGPVVYPDRSVGAGGEVVRIPGVTLAGVFDARTQEVARSKAVWRNWFLANIVLLFAVAVAVFFVFVSDAGSLARSWFEFAVMFPLVYSAIFFHAQHAKAREYLEEYSFKSVVAGSLESSLVMLRKDVNPKHPDEVKKYLEFLVDTMQGLYTPPRTIISKHPVKDEGDVKVGVVEQLGNVFKKFIPTKF